MAKVLTTESTLGCTVNGKANLVSSAKLKVRGNPVISKSSASIPIPLTGCKTPPSNSSTPCTKIESLSNHVASKLKVNGSPVLLDSLQGQTDGSVDTVSVKANQSKLNAI